MNSSLQTCSCLFKSEMCYFKNVTCSSRSLFILFFSLFLVFYVMFAFIGLVLVVYLIVLWCNLDGKYSDYEAFLQAFLSAQNDC